MATPAIIAITPGSGQNLDAVQLTVGLNTVVRETMVIADPTSATQLAGVTAGGALQVDASATTQPISGTITANQGTSPWVVSLTSTTITGSVAVTGTFWQTTQPVSIASTVIVAGTLTHNNAAPAATQIGVLPAIANIAHPTYTEGDQVLLSTDLTGALRVNIAGTVLATNNIEQWNSVALGSPSAYGTSPGAVNVIGVNAYVTSLPAITVAAAQTIAVTNAGTFAVQATLSAETTKVIGTVNQGTSPWIVAGGGTAGSPGTAVLTVQGIGGGTAIPVSGSFYQATQPISIASGQVVSGAFSSGSIASGAVASGAIASGAFASGAISAGAASTSGGGAFPDGSVFVRSNAASTFPVTATIAASQTIAVTNVGTFAVQAAITAASGSIASGAIASGAIASGALASGSISAGAASTSGGGAFPDGSVFVRSANASTFPVTATIAAAQTIAVTNTGTFAVQDTVLDAALIAQEASTSGVKGLTAFGAVTTAAPSYSTGKSDALSLDTAGNLRAVLNAETTKVIGTVNQGTSPWIVAGGGTAGSSGTAVLTVQGIAGGTTLPVTATIAASQTIAVTQATASSLNATVVGTLTNNNAAPGATNVGVLPAIANALTQAFTEGDQVLLSADLTGAIRVIPAFIGTGADGTSNTNTAAALMGRGSGSGFLQTMPTLFNGTTWDRIRSAGIGNGVASTGIVAAAEYVQYNSTIQALTAAQYSVAQADTTGSAYVNMEGRKATYSAFASFTAAAGDIAVLPGSASKTIRVIRVEVSFTTSGTAAVEAVQLIKRSAADTGGTSAAMTAVPHDSNFSAASAAPLNYTVAPTPGAAVGTIRGVQFNDASSLVPGANTWIWDFGARPSAAIVLRGVAQMLCIALPTAIATQTATISFEWTEE